MPRKVAAVGGSPHTPQSQVSWNWDRPRNTVQKEMVEASVMGEVQTSPPWRTAVSHPGNRKALLGPSGCQFKTVQGSGGLPLSGLRMIQPTCREEHTIAGGNGPLY